MADKNKGESVRNANPHDLKNHFEFVYAIVVAIGNNCPTGEWRSWEDVLGNVKKAMIDEVLMSHLIRTRRAMTSTPSLMATPSSMATPSPTTTPTTVATAPVEKDHRPVNPASSTSLVALPVSARRTHRCPALQTISKKNTWGPCWQLKTAKVTRVTNSGIPIKYDERHRATQTAEQHSALAHDIGHVVRIFCPMPWKSWKAMPEETKNTMRNQLSVVLKEGCPKELEDRQDSWICLCGHFQETGYVKKAKVNKINRKKKTLLHYSGSRPFCYRMEAWQKIDVFADVYVQPGDELTESLHSASQLPSNTPIESVDPPKDAGFHIITETLDQTFDRRRGTYRRGMGNARRQESRASSSSQSKGQVTSLTQEVAGLKSELASYKSQMLILVQALNSSGIHLPRFFCIITLTALPHRASITIRPADLRPCPQPAARSFEQHSYRFFHFFS
ncbi:hypothetical protein D8674_013315 [Pyrus ussuriensis x Pyrus communis]|uniref:Uncharacterized protein n=1 Tax=Pyrus ussuriensis x Pyrus communis TaxID=2448454 RepID=A0A5N5GPC5_9ROSA|nr:hypothetical protein D8674_013315 [Pyrus ussuriensis x Pyrus communis]